MTVLKSFVCVCLYMCVWGGEVKIRNNRKIYIYMQIYTERIVLLKYLRKFS